jgi:chromosome segregation ATPase
MPAWQQPDELAFDLKSVARNADCEARQSMPIKPTLTNSSPSTDTAADSRMPPPTPKDGATARIDQAHTSRSQAARVDQEVAATPAMLATVAGRDPSHLGDQMNRQAAQLGENLRGEQRDLDHRQAEFNARIAKMENEMRTARLVLYERELELREQASEFQRRWQDLQIRTANVSVAELALKSDDESQSAQSCLEQQNAEIKEALGRWQSRVEELEDSERKLQAQMSDVAEQRRQLQIKQEHLEHTNRADHEQLGQEINEIQTKLQRRWQQLQQRGKTLEQRRGSLERMHADVMRMYREATETRLATEELWGQLNKTVSPAKLTKSMAELRKKLADQFQMASDSLTVKRQELSKMVTQLRDHRKKLRHQRDRVHGWLTRQHDEIEQQAARLIAREHELDQRERQMQDKEEFSRDKQNKYEQDLRRLRRLEPGA